MTDPEYTNLDDYYPIYLTQHADKTNRGLHLVGTVLALLQLLITIFDVSLFNIILIPLVWYGFAFAGHYIFEKNKPTTMQYPWMSIKCELRRTKEIVMR
jgi:hypothetical protein